MQCERIQESEPKQETEPEKKIITMATSEASKTIGSCGEGKACCKCGEGWTCEVTKTSGPDSGKAYFKCGEGCICEIGEGTCEITKGVTGGEVICQCGEGWTCVITKTDVTKIGKSFAECSEGGGCECEPASA